MLVAEIGTDMSRCGTAARLAAWAGVAPGNDESAGKRRFGKTRKGNRALRTWARAIGPQCHAYQGDLSGDALPPAGRHDGGSNAR